MNSMNDKEIISVRDRISVVDAIKFALKLCPEFGEKFIQYEIEEVYEGLLEFEEMTKHLEEGTSYFPSLANVVSTGYCSLMEQHEEAGGFSHRASTYIALEFWTILVERVGRYVRYNNMPESSIPEKINEKI